MNYQEQYKELLGDLVAYGSKTDDRTGVGTVRLFGQCLKFDLNDGFPMLTLRKLHFSTVEKEMLWFLRGEESTKWLEEQGCKIWKPWAKENGYVGPIYGVQWRRWMDAENQREIDQLRNAVDQIRTNPTSRRILVSAWNVANLDAMGLPPCPFAFQFYVTADKKLSTIVYQRSADVVVGLPHDVAGYALLTHMVAEVTGLGVGELMFVISDAHVYLNHLDAAREMLSRDAKPLPSIQTQRTGQEDPDNVAWPRVARPGIDGFMLGDFYLKGYDPHPAIKVEVAV